MPLVGADSGRAVLSWAIRSMVVDTNGFAALFQSCSYAAIGMIYMTGDPDWRAAGTRHAEKDLDVFGETLRPGRLAGVVA